MKTNKSEERTDNFRRNRDLEEFLNEINNDLWETEKKLLKDEFKEFPMVFIVGPLRSGSTLMLQWLASTGQFSYPTNILSRFYKTPIIGSKIQMLLTDERYNFRNEIRDFNSEINFESLNGKTLGALSPNEFWYFWRRFLPFDDLDFATNEELLDVVDVKTLRKEFHGIASVFEKPFALKAMICNYNIEFLNEVFDKALFIYTKRDPHTNIESALKARVRQLGDIKRWYSFKIPEYKQLIKIQDPVKQTAGQIYYINKAVQTALSKIDEDKKVVVDYENFCNDPKSYYDEIISKLKKQGYSISSNYIGAKSFNVTRTKVSNEKIIDAYKYFCSKGDKET